MLTYLLKSVACMAIFLAFYKLLLEKENMHIFKRFFLLASLVFSLIVPGIVFTEYVESQPMKPITSEHVSDVNEITDIAAGSASYILDIEPILWTIYFLGILFFGIKFLKNLFQIFRKIRRNSKLRMPLFTLVLLQEKIPPHTFFNYIFLNKRKLESNEIPEEVLLHEETHARQKHSLDVVLAELFHVVFWFNPFVYLIKKSIKLNHEFLADQAVLQKDIDQTDYQNTLLSYLSRDSQKKYQPQLANAINYSSYSSIKKRFTVMKTQTSKKAIFLRTLLLLPMLTLMLYGFSSKIIVRKEIPVSLELFQEEVKPSGLMKDITLAKKYNTAPFLEFVDSKLVNQEGATNKQLAEYNGLAKQYNTMLMEDNIRIRKSDVDRLEHLYNLMTEEQRSNAEPFPDFPEPPAPPMPPARIEMEAEVSRQQQIEMEQQALVMEEQEVEMEKQAMKMEQQRVEMEKQAIEMEKHTMRTPPEPPMPPEPKSPLEFIREMKKKNAVFYYEDKKITAKRAIELVKESTEINIEAKHTGLNQPVVKLSAEPFVLDN